MKMLVAALIGAFVLGFVDAKLLADKVHSMVTDPAMQGVATAGVAAFMGTVWGWFAKGLLGNKAKE